MGRENLSAFVEAERTKRQIIEVCVQVRVDTKKLQTLVNKLKKLSVVDKERLW
jgi:hypothetical protein